MRVQRAHLHLEMTVLKTTSNFLHLLSITWARELHLSLTPWSWGGGDQTIYQEGNEALLSGG